MGIDIGIVILVVFCSLLGYGLGRVTKAIDIEREEEKNKIKRYFVIRKK